MPTDAGNWRVGALPGGTERERVAPAQEASGEENAFAAVSVGCGEGACFSAAAISGIRFLVEEAPRLPMSSCTAETCSCRYFHFRDRRSFLGNRRSGAGLEGVPARPPSARDRRQGPNRRRLKILDMDRPA